MALGTPQQLKHYLEAVEPRLHPVWGIPPEYLKSPGYHTLIPDGSWVHSTRIGARYSVALLQSKEAKWKKHFTKVWEAILSFQETDPYKATFGIWPWFCEEPLPKMAPPDWNWADFIGSQIAQLLRDHSAEIDPALLEKLKKALHRASWSIFRRNVQPGYTNIALMGAAVTGATGELLGESDLLDYGRQRLKTFAEHTRHHGDFNEYNSPGYTLVAIEELDRILYLVKDIEMRTLAEELRQHAWTVVGEHYHRPTQTWSGPNSRRYQEFLNGEQKRFLREYAEVEFPLDRDVENVPPVAEIDFDLFPRVSCPEELKPLFKKDFNTPYELKKRFIRTPEEKDSIVGTTYNTATYSLASVNREIFWTQRRPVLGYWKNESSRPAQLRLRMLHDGRDFASGMLYSAQDKNRLLVTAGFVKNRGDFHPSLDRPAEPIFACRDLLLRWELIANQGSVTILKNNEGVLRSGKVNALIKLPKLEMEGRSLSWEIGEEALTFEGAPTKKYWIQANLWKGPTKNFDLRKLSPTHLATGVEILLDQQKSTGLSFETAESQVTWGNLSLPWITEISEVDLAEKA